ncbi:N-acetylglucosamine-6-phosphate deacetylase [Pacificoceanicola onchidii]|uniref:N-acetylglucosamine-6-phosphate deacetylase n=1 Tax=Pacificoceanicola onchidii TaxID=2562685 RepID=UPI0010A441AA|nr:N-acetylglucosamine-6-phosphate deacetylase [Pacificoceanicola onchidii]
MTQVYTGARIFDGKAFRDGPLVVSEGTIAEHGAGETVTLDGGLLVPGFVDLQVNGGGGRMFNHSPDVETLRIMAEAHARLGATTFLPTLITDTPEITAAAITAVRDAIAQGVPGIAGLHLEGPHLARPKAGAHDPDLIRPMTQSDLALLLEAASFLPLLKITVAPETVTPDQIARLAGAGGLVSLGHSDCDFPTAQAAAGAGARCVTHLFNAMSQITSRAPGLAGAALADGRLSAGLIADGIHVHPATMALALAAKQGPGQVFLVSDAMAVAGSDAQGFSLNGRTVLRAEGRLTLEDGTLAGADLDLATAIRNVTALDIPPDQALAMATRIPAEIAGLDAGRLTPGAAADMVWLSENFDLRGVWRRGVRL